MWRFIVFLIVLIASVWLGLQIAKDPGLAFFSYREWSVEMPLWFAALSFIVLLLVFYFILRVFTGIDSLFYRWNNWLRFRRIHKSYNKTNRGLVELLEGHWKNAEHYLLDGIPQADAKLINYLGLAKAAHEQGAYERRDVYLRKAHASAPQADVAVGLTQAQLQYNQGQFESALATLGHLRTVTPYHGLVLKLLERLYVHLGDWQNLLKLLPSMYKAGIISREQLTMLEKKTYEELLKQQVYRPDGLTALQALWKSIPSKFQKDPEIVYCYVKQLFPYPDMSAEIDTLINKALKKAWNADLVKLYGNLKYDAKKQLVQAESLLKRYHNQPVLLLTLGKLCARCQLWGKARHYFEDSLNLEANPETFSEYGKLLEQLDDSTAAMESYRDGLLLLTEKSSS